jgi:hypothetical protein
MTRSAVWFVAFALAERQMRGAVRFVDGTDPSGPFVRREPLTLAEIGQACAKEADQCEAAFVAAEGSSPT